MIPLSEGDILTLKKKHPCGGDRFEVLRAASDVRLKCICCGKNLLLPRYEVEKALKTKAAKAEG